jgi:hypothetical protein
MPYDQKRVVRVSPRDSVVAIELDACVGQEVGPVQDDDLPAPIGGVNGGLASRLQQAALGHHGKARVAKGVGLDREFRVDDRAYNARAV